ncbi:kinase-like protein [Gloeophyllum trabeum ATCC 11539]|uniref:Kinase-like protein n=1 Tax=Gloeophyllum trabeum (strain ATCC 11539 / FP-39264 / Madison 617) TaxID=670483 RepID=S7RR32_GLOTA|nr:kinase-like protein [Gloeophyllum trabeum ATCC 11539]EPQ55379.1 kinase-like protein [Gloeophyllum trabeum ATCC 11539]
MQLLILPNEYLEVERGVDWDISHYIATYLGNQKVTVQAITAAPAGESAWIDVSSFPIFFEGFLNSLSQLFDKETRLWLKAWEKDKGKYISPVYGFLPDPQPSFPWLECATRYLINNPMADHMHINSACQIRGIAKGLLFLHEMDIVHGDIRGVRDFTDGHLVCPTDDSKTTVMINSDGNPLLSEGGVFNVVCNADQKIKDEQGFLLLAFRAANWHAPELHRNLDVPAAPTKQSDVYSFGMTVLELLTHERPYRAMRSYGVTYHVQHTPGFRPSRPEDDVVRLRGLNDALWDFLQECWSEDPARRPSMHRVVEVMDSI